MPTVVLRDKGPPRRIAPPRGRDAHTGRGPRESSAEPLGRCRRRGSEDLAARSSYARGNIVFGQRFWAETYARAALRNTVD